MTAKFDVAAEYIESFFRLSRDVRLFLVSVLVSGVCYMGLYFLLINLYLLRLGYGLEFIGVFVSTGAFSFAISSLPAGIAGRRFGSRRPMIFGMVVLTVGLGMLALTAWVPAAWRTAWLIFFCGLREFGNAFYLVNSTPYLMSATTVEERNYAFSVRGTLTPVAGFLGTLIGGFLPLLSEAYIGWSADDPLNYMVPLLLSSLLLLPGIVALCATREVEAGERAREVEERGAMPLGLLLPIAAVSGLFVVAASAGQSFYSVYMDTVLQAPTELIGVVASSGQLMTAALMLLAPALMARWGHAGTFVRGGLCMGLSLLPMALISHWLAAGVSTVGVVVMMTFSSTALMVFHQGLVPVGWRPAMSGASLMAMGVGWGIVSSGGGYFIAAFGWALFFLLAGGGTLLGVGVFLLRFGVKRA